MAKGVKNGDFLSLGVEVEENWAKVFPKRNTKRLAEWIRRFRSCMNLSQRALAERLKVCQRTVSVWESGKECPSEQYWHELRKIFTADPLGIGAGPKLFEVESEMRKGQVPGPTGLEAQKAIGSFKPNFKPIPAKPSEPLPLRQQRTLTEEDDGLMAEVCKNLTKNITRVPVKAAPTTITMKAAGIEVVGVASEVATFVREAGLLAVTAAAPKRMLEGPQGETGPRGDFASEIDGEDAVGKPVTKVESGFCFGAFHPAAPECSRCLVSKQCAKEASKQE
jgi:DNA-binding transcriptional regulator YiaG